MPLRKAKSARREGNAGGGACVGGRKIPQASSTSPCWGRCTTLPVLCTDPRTDTPFQAPRRAETSQRRCIEYVLYLKHGGPSGTEHRNLAGTSSVPNQPWDVLQELLPP